MSVYWTNGSKRKRRRRASVSFEWIVFHCVIIVMYALAAFAYSTSR
jgi:hypothetical protein